VVDAIVLAGGGPEPGLPPGIPNKGFVMVAGRPLVAHVVAALQGARGIGRIAVVGPSGLQTVLPSGLLLVAEAGGIMDNVVQAALALGSSESILVAASDVPLLTGEVVDEFLTACARQPADFHYAVVPKTAMDQQFPTAQKTYVTLTDGTFCGGNLMLFNPRVVNRVRPFVERMIAARKKPWLMAQLIGWATVMKMISHQLSIADLVARVTEVVGISVQPVIIPRPEVALDVDVGKPDNLELIRRALEQRGRP
jgi:molybdopterin-guanine dinucleotide biosynthesis protein A